MIVASTSQILTSRGKISAVLMIEGFADFPARGAAAGGEMLPRHCPASA